MKHNEIYDLYSCLKKYINFENKTILDFGGSFGNLIASSNGKISEKNYTCVDVDSEALKEGYKNFPHAQWIWYNRYNTSYNPTGKDVWPDLKKYDLIFSYSVFTHSSYEDLVETISYLKTRLNKDGEIYISYASQDNISLINWLTSKRASEYGFFDKIVKNDTYVYIKDNIVVNEIPSQSKYFFTLYNDSYLESLGDIIKVDCVLQDFIRIKSHE
jgi:2-polyprenyl-3-methyl-5-hydroxy-6-metoxy-1,4-benzoquinol methylase